MHDHTYMSDYDHNSSSSSDTESESLLEQEFLKKLELFEEQGPYTKDKFLSLCKECYKDKIELMCCDSLAAAIHKFPIDELAKLKTLTPRERKYYDNVTCRSIPSVVVSASYDMTKPQIMVFRDLIDPRDMLMQLVETHTVDINKYLLIRDILQDKHLEWDFK